MNETLATEIIHELKTNSKRWFIAFIVALGLWFATIGAFIGYMCLPSESAHSAEVYSEDGNASYVGKDMNGVITNGGMGKGDKDGTPGKEAPQTTKTP